MGLNWQALTGICLIALCGKAAQANCNNTVPMSVGASVLSVLTEDGTTGSGVVVAKDRVLTVAHAVRGIGTVEVRVDGRLMRAHPVAFDLRHDLALLAINTADAPHVDLMPRALQRSEGIWVAGYPRGENRQFSYGDVVGPWMESTRVTAWVEEGQSGGALFGCDSGKVFLAGTLTGYGALETEGEPTRLADFSLAVPVARIRTFLTAAGVAVNSQIEPESVFSAAAVFAN